jgi:hypothetical protein
MNLILAIIAILLSVVAGGLALVLWKKTAKLKIHQDGLFQEISALTIANKRLIDRIRFLENRAQPAIKQTDPVRKTEETGGERAPRPSNEEQKNLWQDVIFLAKQGLSADTIARDLNITRGEVELILGLHNFKPKDD